MSLYKCNQNDNPSHEWNTTLSETKQTSKTEVKIWRPMDVNNYPEFRINRDSVWLGYDGSK